MRKGETAYGWQDFDPHVVSAIERGESDFVDATTGMRCPLADHDAEWLEWREGKPRKGTKPHGDIAVRFHSSPTYVLGDARQNFILGRSVIETLTKEGGKAETHRLGNENSEDALSFNVFRSLQVAGKLHLVAKMVAGERHPEPRLFIWGQELTLGGKLRSWSALEEARRTIEPSNRRHTEPDICLQVPGWGWIFVEAKFGSANAVPQDDRKHELWLNTYLPHGDDVLDHDETRSLPRRGLPEQLLRNVLFARAVCGPDERATVVALGRRQDGVAAAERAAACLRPDSPVSVLPMSWEDTYASLPRTGELADLRNYLGGKSYRLRPAFDLGGP